MWYKFANQFGEPTPFVPEPSRQMGSNEQEALADVETPAFDKRKKDLANPKKDPYQQTIEGQLQYLHHESQNQLDPNSSQYDQLWRGLDIKKQSDAAFPQDKNWPASLGKVQV